MERRAACQRCRTKKLKCNGQLPRCATCIGADVECTPGTTPAQRGPKKGHLRALQTKIDDLQQQLAEAHRAVPGHACPPGQSSSQLPPVPPVSSFTHNVAGDSSLPQQPFIDQSPYDIAAMDAYHSPLPGDWLGDDVDLWGVVTDTGNSSLGWSNVSPQAYLHQAPIDSVYGNNVAALPDATWTELRPVETPCISDLVQSDLNQLFFERAHHCVAMIHQRNYFSWAQSPSKTAVQSCLQHAMWTMAASLSANSQELQKQLCHTTNKLLTALSEDLDACMSLEYIQARILMSLHAFVHHNHRMGWMSAGECFRLVQLTRLHELDDALQNEISAQQDSRNWIILEEKRRAFWMSYCIDILVSKRGDWPLTLHEHVKGTRLPMPDERFQNDEPVEMQYLSDVYDTASGITPNPFLELIIFCTISCDSSFLKAHHRSMAAADIFRAQLKLLNTLDANIERLQASYSVAQWKCHPIVHFTQMFANALTICLCGYLKTFAPAEKEGHDRFIARMKQRAIKAALDLLKLARYIAKLSYFKIHPFSPLPLGSCCTCLRTMWSDQEMELATAKEELATLLLDMSSMNKIAQDHLMEL